MGHHQKSGEMAPQEDYNNTQPIQKFENTPLGRAAKNQSSRKLDNTFQMTKRDPSQDSQVTLTQHNSHKYL